MTTEQFHIDTHRAAIIWEKRNRMVGGIPKSIVAALSQALTMGFDPLTACVEVECLPWHSAIVLGAQLKLAA